MMKKLKFHRSRLMMKKSKVHRSRLRMNKSKVPQTLNDDEVGNHKKPVEDEEVESPTEAIKG